MAQLFKPSSNTYAKLSIFGALFAVGGLLVGLNEFNRSSYMTSESVAREQPVPFSHKHHVGELGIDCRYCHTTVESSAFAGIPATQICMNCHSQIWKDAPMLEPVRASYRTGKSLEWTRVNDLPDFVYFDHSIHIAKGVGCASCHGDVTAMNLTWQAAPMTMEWCLSCHRDPVRNLRPREKVFDTTWVLREHEPVTATAHLIPTGDGVVRLPEVEPAHIQGEGAHASGGHEAADAEHGAAEDHGTAASHGTAAGAHGASPHASPYAGMDQTQLGLQLASDYQVRPRTDCSTCHR